LIVLLLLATDPESDDGGEEARPKAATARA
jgi:hypothetical protein